MACGSLNHVLSLWFIWIFGNRVIHKRHFNTLTFYYINLKPPPTAMSIKNKQKHLLHYFFYIYTNTQVLCVAVWRIEDRILTWVMTGLFLFFMHWRNGNVHNYICTIRKQWTLHDINYQNTVLQQSQIFFFFLNKWFPVPTLYRSSMKWNLPNMDINTIKVKRNMENVIL